MRTLTCILFSLTLIIGQPLFAADANCRTFSADELDGDSLVALLDEASSDELLQINFGNNEACSIVRGSEPSNEERGSSFHVNPGLDEFAVLVMINNELST